MLQQLTRTTLLAVLVGMSAGCQDDIPAPPPIESTQLVSAPTDPPETDTDDSPPAVVAEPDEPPEPDNPRHALLIGCSKYDHL